MSANQIKRDAVRLIISGGGTGGHVYPALAVTQALTQQRADIDLLWVGSVGGMEQSLVEHEGLTFEAISAGGLRGKNPLAMTGGLWQLSQGYRQSRQIIRRFRPDVLFITGGYVCVPVTLAAWRTELPLIIYLPDIEPGLAIKFLARFANRVAVTASEAQQFFKPGLTVVTGYPVRAALWQQAQVGAKIAARKRLGLTDSRPLLLVFGGSQGARSLNKAITQDLERYLEVCQIIHVTGRLDAAWVQDRWAALSPAQQARYRVSAYLHDDMTTALLAADLAVSRAGASTLGEFPAVGLPAILVPYPYAGAHQQLNADYLATHQAAVVIDDAALNSKLRPTVMNLVQNQDKLMAMRHASQALAQPTAAQKLAQEILELAYARS